MFLKRRATQSRHERKKKKLILLRTGLKTEEMSRSLVFLIFVTLRTVKKFFLPHAADQMETERPVRGVAFGKSFDVAHLDAEYKGENNTEDESFGHAQHGVHSCRVKKKRKIVTNKIKTGL